MTDANLPLTADDGWDMSPRRDEIVTVDMPTSFESLTPEAPAAAPKMMTSRGRLSPEEIEMLLRPDLSDMEDLPEEPAPETITPRDIPDLAEKIAVAMPAPTDEKAEHARRLASRLSLALREHCGLRAAATVASAVAGDFHGALTDQARDKGRAVACFTGPSGEIAAMLSLAPALSSALIETACGGKVGPYSPRSLTPLDGALLEGLVRPLGNAISTHLSFARIETDAEFASVLAAPGPARIIDFDVRVEAQSMSARLVLIEDDLFEPEIAAAAPANEAANEPALPAPAPTQAAMTAVLTARVASLSVPLSRLTNLKAGSTLLLGLPADQPVELLSGDRYGPVAAEAQIGRKGNKMALRITKRGPALR